MGYTHYWYRNVDEPSDAYGRFAMDAKRIIDVAELAYGIRLGDWKGDPFAPGEGPVTEGEIRFNGLRGGSGGCETFIWPARNAHDSSWPSSRKGMVFNCTKTRYLPYGEVICALLIRAPKYYDDLIISSDGDFDDEQWRGGMDIVASTFLDEIHTFPYHPEGITA
jgi:hypothetical protein